MKFVQQHLRRHLAAPHDLAQRIEEAGFVAAARILAVARREPGARDIHHLARNIAQGPPARDRRVEPQLRHRRTQRLALLHRPALDHIPRRIERTLVVQQPDPQRRERANPPPRPTIRPAHFEEGLQPHLGEGGRQMIVPIVHRRLLARQDRQFALEEIAERQASGVDVFAVAINKVHRHIERIVGVALIPKAILEHERQHPGPRRIGVGPDMAAV